MIPKRNFYNNKDYFLDENKRIVTLSKEFHQKLLAGVPGKSFTAFKKVGGSSIGNVLNLDSMHNEFVGFCFISRISLPILDRKYVDAGVTLEPKIVEMIEAQTLQKVNRYPAEKYNYDFFRNKHPIVGGLPDGYIEKTNSVIEIKTSGLKNKEYWEKYGVPANYLKQAQLYAYLMNADYYFIVASFLNEDDYVHPELVDVNNRQVLIKRYPLDKSQAIDDLKKVEAWYSHYTKTGISPQYDPSYNADLIEWLRCENASQWEQLFRKWVAEGKAVEYDK